MNKTKINHQVLLELLRDFSEDGRLNKNGYRLGLAGRVEMEFDTTISSTTHVSVVKYQEGKCVDSFMVSFTTELNKERETLDDNLEVRIHTYGNSLISVNRKKIIDNNYDEVFKTFKQMRDEYIKDAGNKDLQNIKKQEDKAKEKERIIKRTNFLNNNL